MRPVNETLPSAAARRVVRENGITTLSRRIDLGTGGVSRMKSRDAQIRMKRFQIEERRRQVGQIETMIEEFGRMISDLDHGDRRRAPAHRDRGREAFRLLHLRPRGAAAPRQSCRPPSADLTGQLDTAKAALDLAMAELDARRRSSSARRRTTPVAALRPRGGLGRRLSGRSWRGARRSGAPASSNRPQMRIVQLRHWAAGCQSRSTG